MSPPAGAELAVLGALAASRLAIPRAELADLLRGAGVAGAETVLDAVVGRGWARVDGRIVGWPGRLDTIKVEVETKHADCVLHCVTAPEAIGQRKVTAVRMAHIARILDAKPVVKGDAPQAVV